MQLKQFITELFEFDYTASKKWIRYLVQHEEKLSPRLIQLQSHILNVHHIWNARLLGREVESEDWDLLPISVWERLMEENYRWTSEYLQYYTLSDVIRYTSSENECFEKEAINLLYHILQHTAHHRAQIALLVKERGLEPPEINYITTILK